MMLEQIRVKLFKLKSRWTNPATCEYLWPLTSPKNLEQLDRPDEVTSVIRMGHVSPTLKAVLSSQIDDGLPHLLDAHVVRDHSDAGNPGPARLVIDDGHPIVPVERVGRASPREMFLNMTGETRTFCCAENREKTEIDQFVRELGTHLCASLGICAGGGASGPSFSFLFYISILYIKSQSLCQNQKNPYDIGI